MIAEGRHDDHLAAYRRCRCDTCLEDMRLERQAKTSTPPRSDGRTMRGDAMGEAPEWMSNPRRACRGIDTDEFFPSDGSVPYEAQLACLTCPVVLECRRWGIAHEEFGVWGGTSEKQRKRLRRELGVQLVEIRINPFPDTELEAS